MAKADCVDQSRGHNTSDSGEDCCGWSKFASQARCQATVPDRVWHERSKVRSTRTRPRLQVCGRGHAAGPYFVQVRGDIHKRVAPVDGRDAGAEGRALVADVCHEALGPLRRERRLRRKGTDVNNLRESWSVARGAGDSNRASRCLIETVSAVTGLWWNPRPHTRAGPRP